MAHEKDVIELAQAHTSRFVTGLEIAQEVVNTRYGGSITNEHDRQQAVAHAMNRVFFEHIEGVGLQRRVSEDEEAALYVGAQEAIEKVFKSTGGGDE